MKLKILESHLGTLEGFQKPKVLLEQYMTQPHIAARVLYTIRTQFDDIKDQLVVDLGCGTGVLSIGAALLGAGACIGFDVDESALAICKQNCDEMEVNNVTTTLIDVNQLSATRQPVADIVITNPPFGTKKNEGAGMSFVKKGLSIAGTVYSLHKTSTRKHIEKQAAKWGVDMEVVAELKFDLPQSYKFHKHTSLDIEVDFIRFANPI